MGSGEGVGVGVFSTGRLFALPDSVGGTRLDCAVISAVTIKAIKANKKGKILIPIQCSFYDAAPHIKRCKARKNSGAKRTKKGAKMPPGRGGIKMKCDYRPALLLFPTM